MLTRCAVCDRSVHHPACPALVSHEFARAALALSEPALNDNASPEEFWAAEMPRTSRTRARAALAALQDATLGAIVALSTGVL